MQKQWKEEDDQEAILHPTGACWKQKKKKQFTCPVCRDVINVDLDVLKQAPQPYEVGNFKTEFRKDVKFTSLRKKMDIAYQKQKLNGGIIDQIAEDNRFLVTTDAPIPVTQSAPVPIPEPVAIQASAKPDCSRDQSKRGRGKWMRKPDAHKERVPPSNSLLCPQTKSASNRGSRNSSANVKETRTPRESNQRHSGRDNTNPITSNGARPCLPVNRPPPGFEPRLIILVFNLQVYLIYIIYFIFALFFFQV